MLLFQGYISLPVLVPMTRTRSRTDKDQQKQPQASCSTPGQWVGGTAGQSSGGTGVAHNFSNRGMSVTKEIVTSLHTDVIV